MLTEANLRAAFPQCKSPAAWAAALQPAMDRFQINTPSRVARFLAQTGYESGQFNLLNENMTYSTAARLMAVWPKRFPTTASATPFVNNPQALANAVYANRMGNGNVASGDGWRFHGRGLIQLTGRSNYMACGKALGLDLVTNPDLLLAPPQAALSAAWFWESRGLNALADDHTGASDLEDFTQITRLINGGTVGLQARLALLATVESALA